MIYSKVNLVTFSNKESVKTLRNLILEKNPGFMVVEPQSTSFPLKCCMIFDNGLKIATLHEVDEEFSL